MTTLTKADMIEHLMHTTALSKQQARQLVDGFFRQISDKLSQGYEVKLSGFGNFELRHKKPRPGRNPKTGEMVPISARRVVTFHAGQKFRQRIGD